jgi:hypothetical protein
MQMSRFLKKEGVLLLGIRRRRRRLVVAASDNNKEIAKCPR